jgi:hypothetical protein
MKKYEFIGKAVYIEKIKTLVITDIHLGFEEYMEQQGVYVPRTQYREVIRDSEGIFQKLGQREIREILILGDLKHEFGTISRQEWREVSDFIDFLKQKAGEKVKIILLKGNHDNILGPIAGKKQTEIREFYVKEEFGFLHGNKKIKEVLDKKIKIIFLGHFHPAITIREGAKSERYKCFLEGEWKGKRIVILPSFFPLTEGTDVLIENTNLDFDFNVENFRVYIPGDGEVLEFGKVRNVGILG